MSRRDGNDFDGDRKPVVFSDETLPVVSCKEVIHKDPVLVFFWELVFNHLFLFDYRHSVNTGAQTEFKVQLNEVACQSLKQKEREVGNRIDQFR